MDALVKPVVICNEGCELFLEYDELTNSLKCSLNNDIIRFSLISGTKFIIDVIDYKNNILSLDTDCGRQDINFNIVDDNIAFKFRNINLDDIKIRRYSDTDLGKRISEIIEEAYMTFFDTAFVFRYINGKLCIVCYNFNDLGNTIIFSIRQGKDLLLEYRTMEDLYFYKSQLIAEKNKKILVEGAIEWANLQEQR